MLFSGSSKGRWDCLCPTRPPAVGVRIRLRTLRAASHIVFAGATDADGLLGRQGISLTTGMCRVLASDLFRSRPFALSLPRTCAAVPFPPVLFPSSQAVADTCVRTCAGRGCTRPVPSTQSIRQDIKLLANCSRRSCCACSVQHYCIRHREREREPERETRERESERERQID